MILWIHDPDANPTLSRREAVLNYDLFAPGVAKPRDIAEVRLLPGTGVADEGGIGGENMERKRSVSNCVGAGAGGGDETERALPQMGKGKGKGGEKRFLFVIRELRPEQRAKPNLQVCGSMIELLGRGFLFR